MSEIHGGCRSTPSRIHGTTQAYFRWTREYYTVSPRSNQSAVVNLRSLVAVMVSMASFVNFVLRNCPTYTCTVMDARSSLVRTLTSAVAAISKGGTRCFIKCTLPTQSHPVSSTTLGMKPTPAKQNVSARIEENAVTVPTAPNALVGVINGSPSTFDLCVLKTRSRCLKKSKILLPRIQVHNLLKQVGKVAIPLAGSKMNAPK